MNIDIIIEALNEDIWDWREDPANDNRMIDYMTMEQWLECHDLSDEDIELIEN